MKKFVSMIAGLIGGVAVATSTPATAIAPLAVEPSIAYFGCQVTLEPTPKHNGLGHIMVRAGTYDASVSKYVNGKRTGTYKVKAGQSRIIEFKTPNTRQVTKFSLKVAGTSRPNSITEIGKAMCLADK